MKFENTKIFGFELALQGMRLPMCKDYKEAKYKCHIVLNIDEELSKDSYSFVDKDTMRIAKNLVKADKSYCGQPNSKFLRMIHVQVAITAPMYWWSEMDTYKVGTVSNSTSKMHTLAKYPITKDCFEMSDFNIVPTIHDSSFEEFEDGGNHVNTQAMWNETIAYLEALRNNFNETKDKRYWKELLRLLPSSWLQTRMWDANYEVIRNIYSQRKNHKLKEWKEDFCNWIKSLPYSEEFLIN